MPRVTGTLTQVAVGLPIVNVADVAGAQTATDVSTALSAAEDYADGAVAAIPDATESAKGLATAAQITRLNGIEAGAQVNLAVGTTPGTVAAGDDSRLGTVQVHLPSGSTVAASGIEASDFPGTTVTAGVLSIGRGGQSDTATALSADASSAVITQILTGLGNSKVYVARIGVRVTIWKDATKAHCGNLDADFDVHIATDGAGVATVTLATTPSFDTSKLIAGLSGAAATVAASTGGFTVSVTRVAGVACSAVAAWWCFTLRDIT